MALMKLGHFNEAIEAGKKAVELRPNESDRMDQSLVILQSRRQHQRGRSSWCEGKILGWGGKIA